jgi:hypothetical protein
MFSSSSLKLYGNATSRNSMKTKLFVREIYVSIVYSEIHSSHETLTINSGEIYIYLCFYRFQTPFLFFWLICFGVKCFCSIWKLI